MKVKAIKRHKYGNKGRAQGEEYEVSNSTHARWLEALGLIRRVAEKAPVLIKPPPQEKKTERPLPVIVLCPTQTPIR
jgi:hypothetical protein